ncbi:MAG: hypothetical protein WC462_04195 [archaeon]
MPVINRIRGAIQKRSRLNRIARNETWKTIGKMARADPYTKLSLLERSRILKEKKKKIAKRAKRIFNGQKAHTENTRPITTQKEW